MELTVEQLSQAETMSLEELRVLALKEAEEATAPPVQVQESKDSKNRARDEQGRFTSADTIDNSDDAQAADPVDDATTIYRKEIDNGNGSVDVYEADSLEELVDKIAEGKRNANKKIQEFIAERKQTAALTDQQTKDAEYVVEQNLKTKPIQTIKELAKQAVAEEQEKLHRSQEAQERFVTTHPDFIPNPDNGKRMAAEYQRMFGSNSEFSSDGLEKAYQSLKASGLLKLKDTEANDATEAETKVTEQTVQPTVEATQQRSSKKGSTISTRTAPRTVAPVNTKPTLDEAYEMPLEELRKLANAQLAGQ